MLNRKKISELELNDTLMPKIVYGAVENNSADLVKLLLHDKKQSDFSNQPLLQFDFADERPSQLEAKHIARHSVGYMRWQPIHVAANKGYFDIVKILLDYDPSLVNELDALQQTPLLLAASQGHTKVAELLLHSGADMHVATHAPEDRKHHGRTALQWAIAHHHAKTRDLLLYHLDLEHQDKQKQPSQVEENPVDLIPKPKKLFKSIFNLSNLWRKPAPANSGIQLESPDEEELSRCRFE